MWFGNQETRKFFIKLVGNGWESAKLRPANDQFLAPLAKGMTNEKFWSSQRCMQSWPENFTCMHSPESKDEVLSESSLTFIGNSTNRAA